MLQINAQITLPKIQSEILSSQPVVTRLNTQKRKMEGSQ